MSKFNKFLAVGALALTCVVNSFAADIGNNDIQMLKEINSNIQTVVQHQFKKGFLTEPALIDVSIVHPDTIVPFQSFEEMIGRNLKESEIKQTDLSMNKAIRLGDVCRVSLAFDENGGIPYLGEDHDLQKITELQNDKQRDYIRQFVALHEHYHCEFSNINNPIQIENEDDSFINSLNYNLKGVNALTLGDVSYMATLNENFADISAKMALIKEYGANDKDLAFVLKVIETQRADTYLQNKIDNHFTSISLELLSKPENIEKLNNVNNGQEFKELALKLANKGTEQVLATKTDLAKGMFSEDSFQLSLLVGIAIEIKNNFNIINNPKLVQKENSNIEEGVITATSKKLTSNINYSALPLIFDIDDIYNLACVTLAAKENRSLIKSSYREFNETTEKFQSYITKSNKNKKLMDLDDPDNKTEILKRITMLKTTFVEDAKNISNVLKF